MLSSHHITIPYQARYYQLGEISNSTKQIWFVLHGYAQLSQYFIKKFEILSQNNICVIAPEGLSRFYISGGSGRVGASWMTRENRLIDITNYLTYLNEVYHTQQVPSDIPVTILGFSQGAATASRWVMDQHVKFSRLILWAGIFPPDMDFSRGKEVLKQKEIHLVYGLNDPFINDDRMAEMNLIIEKLEVVPKVTTFEGVHQIIPEVLKIFF